LHLWAEPKVVKHIFLCIERASLGAGPEAHRFQETQGDILAQVYELFKTSDSFRKISQLKAKGGFVGRVQQALNKTSVKSRMVDGVDLAIGGKANSGNVHSPKVTMKSKEPFSLWH
jgi:hypothetical protein